MPAAVTPAPRPPVAPIPDSHAVLEEIHRSACSIDLATAPVDGDSWLTGTLIDFVAFQFARNYPDVHFLSTNFAAFELPNSVRNPETLKTFVAQDILGRSITLRPPEVDHQVAMFRTNFKDYRDLRADQLPAGADPAVFGIKPTPPKAGPTAAKR